jgi:hypothetical protein
MNEQPLVREEKTFDVRKAARWTLVVVFAVLVIGLATYARGDEHKRGDDVGALRAGVMIAVR